MQALLALRDVELDRLRVPDVLPARDEADPQPALAGEGDTELRARVRYDLQFTLAEMATTAELLGTGRIGTDGIVTGTVTLDELPSTVADLATGRLDAIKVLVDPTR